MEFNIIFDLQILAYSDKNNPVFGKYVYNKGNIGQDIFLDFAVS